MLPSPSSLIDPAIGHLLELAGNVAAEQPGSLIAGTAEWKR